MSKLPGTAEVQRLVVSSESIRLETSFSTTWSRHKSCGDMIWLDLRAWGDYQLLNLPFSVCSFHLTWWLALSPLHAHLCYVVGNLYDSSIPQFIPFDSNCDTRDGQWKYLKIYIFSGTREKYTHMERCWDPVVEKTMIIDRPFQSYMIVKKHNDLTKGLACLGVHRNC